MKILTQTAYQHERGRLIAKPTAVNLEMYRRYPDLDVWRRVQPPTMTVTSPPRDAP